MATVGGCLALRNGNEAMRRFYDPAGTSSGA